MGKGVWVFDICARSPPPSLSPSLTWATIQHAMDANPARKPTKSRSVYTHSPKTRATVGLAPGSHGVAAIAGREGWPEPDPWIRRPLWRGAQLVAGARGRKPFFFFTPAL